MLGNNDVQGCRSPSGADRLDHDLTEDKARSISLLRLLARRAAEAQVMKPILPRYFRQSARRYRVSRFESLFDWFRIEDSLHAVEVIAAGALKSGQLFLNVGGVRGPERENASEGHTESALEHRLLESSEFAAHYGIAHGTRDRQLPVGLFTEKRPARASQIFPGGKGAIDLVCLDGDTLWLFELKAGGNIPVGTVTELFFYTSLIRDALRGGPFTFAQALPEARLQPDALSKVTRIEGVMLGHDLHPLLDSGLTSILNEAVGIRWNVEPSRARVHFRADRLFEEDKLRIVAAN